MQKTNKIQHDNAADATVVDEQPAPPRVDAPVAYEPLILVLLLLITGGAVVFLGQNAAAITNPRHTPELAVMRTPALVKLPPATAISLAPARSRGGEAESFAGVLEKANVMRQRAAGLSGGSGGEGSGFVAGYSAGANIPPVGSRLTPESYNLMLAYLAQKEGITLEHDARDVLLKAGYTLPPDTGKTARGPKKDHVNFAREVVSSLVKDEVESFLHKLNVVSKVGVYVAEQE